MYFMVATIKLNKMWGYQSDYFLLCLDFQRYRPDYFFNIYHSKVWGKSEF